MADDLTPWSRTVRLAEAQRAPVQLALEADETTRARIAETLGVEAVGRLTAETAVARWQDGVSVRGDWRAEVTQSCGLSLELFDTPLSGSFEVKAVPSDSPLAGQGEPEAEIGLDTPDPPDVLEGETVDVAALVVEHLALEIDPYPRKPGVVFEAPDEAEPESPFAALKALKPQ